MRRLLYITGSLLFMSASAVAMEINLVPGGLADELVTLQNTRDTRLVLTGAADVRDLALLRQLPATVTAIDMSGLTIDAYTYTSGDYMGRTCFAAGEIPPYMLIGSGVESFDFPANVSAIGESAFAATALVTVNIPAGVKSVGSYAFANCASLASFSVNQPVTFGTGVFKDCVRLANVGFGYDIPEIPESMFEGCSAFSLDVPASVTRIGAYAYRGTDIEELNLENALSIGDFAFADMPRLRQVIMSATESVRMGRGVFLNDSGIENLPVWTGEVGEVTFAHTAGITKNLINAENIKEGAYANNMQLDTVILGANVKSIDSHAFRNNTALKVVDVNRLGKNVIDVRPDSFSGLLNDEGRYDISLYCATVNQAPWKAHPVWSLFDIVNGESGVSDNMIDTHLTFNVERHGDVIAVISSETIDYVGVFDMSGMKVYEATPGVNEYRIPELPTGDVLIVKAISAGVVKVAKLM